MLGDRGMSRYLFRSLGLDEELPRLRVLLGTKEKNKPKRACPKIFEFRDHGSVCFLGNKHTVEMADIHV